MTVFRKAFEGDAETLSKLAYHSEAYLGYDFEYMKKFSELYNVTAGFINNNIVYILESEDNPIGFWGLSKENSNYALEFFYIDSAHIGNSYGIKMWKHLIIQCNKIGIPEFYLVTSPQSLGFYKKMGAVVIDNVESLIIPGRIIPKLKYTVNHE